MAEIFKLLERHISSYVILMYMIQNGAEYFS